jgi:hypothetical protein
MDHLDKSLNKTVTLALRKYPATVTNHKKMGAMLVNPVSFAVFSLKPL